MNNQSSITKESNRFEQVLRSAITLPGVKIDRAQFLQSQLAKHFDAEIITKAIETTPAQAGIDVAQLERIANACISFETRNVSAISAAAGIKGGIAMAVTVPLDAAQFFGHVLRVMQKLAYLYGWQEILADNENLDDETTNELTLFIGAMFGVNAAQMTLTKIAFLAAEGVPKYLLRQALTKGTIYPIVKKIAAIVGVKMTKTIFAKSVGKIIPVIGALASGGITFAIFKPMALRLKKYLATLPTADVHFFTEPHNRTNIDDIDFIDIDVQEKDMEAF